MFCAARTGEGIIGVYSSRRRVVSPVSDPKEEFGVLVARNLMCNERELLHKVIYILHLCPINCVHALIYVTDVKRLFIEHFPLLGSCNAQRKFDLVETPYMQWCHPRCAFVLLVGSFQQMFFFVHF